MHTIELCLLFVLLNFLPSKKKCKQMQYFKILKKKSNVLFYKIFRSFSWYEQFLLKNQNIKYETSCYIKSNLICIHDETPS